MDEAFVQHKFLDMVFNVFRDPKRRTILWLLEKNELTADTLAEKLSISRPALEKHIKQMMEFGLIERRAETIPNLHYLYYIPEYTRELVRSLLDTADNFRSAVEAEYNERIENEEQLFILGNISKNHYNAVIKQYESVLNNITGEGERRSKL
ncbi:MAG: winged helix-turn-helix transcriptional regulator [Candidatus Lokiarchaeota archaeon]|nr:winged helix-turn-helix transcriptional regulator [Candidatus Lokiarchaeota archaeon]